MMISTIFHLYILLIFITFIIIIMNACNLHHTQISTLIIDSSTERLYTTLQDDPPSHWLL